MSKPTTKEQMEWFINGIIALFEDLNKPFDEEKGMSFLITEDRHSFKVDFSCINVSVPSSSDDPTKDDSYEKKYESYFIWQKEERLQKLVTYITDELETMMNIIIQTEEEKAWEV